MHVTHYPGGRVVAEITHRRSSNFHAHFRRGAMMHAVARHIVRHVRYVVVMPNTGPIVTIGDALIYLHELRKIADETADHEVDFVMTLYLTDQVTPATIEQLTKLDVKFGVKYYPPVHGATTGSGFGIPLDRCHDTLRAMADCRVPLLGHFEEPLDKHGRELLPEQREGYMVEHVLWRFRHQYPDLRICFEHASTAQAVEWVEADTSGNSVMTVTPQHSLFIGEDFHELGTELKCMPIVKSPEDRDAIVRFITTGDSRAIAGDDTAPHPHPHKAKHLPFGEAANGCWLPHSLELYAEVFDRAGALDGRFEKFVSLNGPAWWGLPPPDEDDTVTLRRKRHPVPGPTAIPGTDDVIVPLGWSEGRKLELQFEVA